MQREGLDGIRGETCANTPCDPRTGDLRGEARKFQ